MFLGQIDVQCWFVTNIWILRPIQWNTASNLYKWSFITQIFNNLLRFNEICTISLYLNWNGKMIILLNPKVWNLICGNVKNLTFLSMPRAKKRVPALWTERLDIKAQVNVLLFTLTWLIEITVKKISGKNQVELDENGKFEFRIHTSMNQW